jgi:hypothetical protein
MNTMTITYRLSSPLVGSWLATTVVEDDSQSLFHAKVTGAVIGLTRQGAEIISAE